MNNFKCTFTGVDEFTDLEKLEELSVRYPFVEWGVLLSTSENRLENGYRYPSYDWLKENLPKLKTIAEKTGCSIALHVCGKETKKILSQAQDSVALELLDFVNRVQINFVYKEDQVLQLEDLCKKFPNKVFITQHNEKNNDLYLKIKSNNHQVLFDASGGRGIECSNWEKPLSDKVCGYAGGLGLDNIELQFESIKKVVKDDFWIDMEGKIRTSDKLDINICKYILYRVSKMI